MQITLGGGFVALETMNGETISKATSAPVARIYGSIDNGRSVSPDQRSVLYSAVERLGSDLMLVDDFRDRGSKFR